MAKKEKKEEKVEVEQKPRIKAKRFIFWCPTCQKKVVYITGQDVVPSAMMCSKCLGQVWRKGVEDINSA